MMKTASTILAACAAISVAYATLGPVAAIAMLVVACVAAFMFACEQAMK